MPGAIIFLGRASDLSGLQTLWLVCQLFTDSGAGEPASKLEDGEVDEEGDVADAPIPAARGGGDRRPRSAVDRVLEPHRPKDDDDDDGLSGLDIFLIVFFVILFAVFNVMAFLVYQKRKREREEDAIALVPPPTYLHPSLHHKTFPGAGPAASYRGRSGAFSDELQPTESFRNVSDPQYEFGTLGGDDMGKAFA